MARARFHIDFLGHRNIMFAISAVLIVVSIGALAIRGLQFGVEFQGGSAFDLTQAGNLSETQVEDAFKKAGMADARIQSTQAENVKGYIIRTSETDPEKANAVAGEVAKNLGLLSKDFRVTTIGPGWGKNITNRAVLALVLSIAAILLYISIRFEYKMSVTAVIALVHDVLIVLGIYALAGQQVTPNTIAALLTILGYSLYDTVVVFHRIKENSQSLQKQTFMDMANESINEVFVRSLNTTITALLPVLVMLFFGGETLKDFAFALTIGLTVGAYSSIGVATPIYVLWKETEPKFQALKKKYATA